MDVAQALANLMRAPPIPQTLSLPGPSSLTFEYLLELVGSITYNPPSRAPVIPKSVALALAKLSQSIWWPTLSPDEVERRFIDDVDIGGDWDTVGVTPGEIESHAITYLRRYRSACVIPPADLSWCTLSDPTPLARISSVQSSFLLGRAWWVYFFFIC
jgi:NADH dehydrogenase (ubiquinone) 1 alpha subcomplex subunit 9